MTRRHFESFARMLRYTRVEYQTVLDWETTVRNVAATCVEFNPAFDRDRFYRACGLGEEA